MFTAILLKLELSWISFKFDIKEFRASIRKERRNRDRRDPLFKQMLENQRSRGAW